MEASPIPPPSPSHNHHFSTTTTTHSPPKQNAAPAPAAEEAPSLDDLLPRADISAAIASPVAALSSPNWKERKAGLDEIEAAIAAAGRRIQPSVGDLFAGLKGRMGDSNKNLVTQVRGWMDGCGWMLLNACGVARVSTHIN